MFAGQGSQRQHLLAYGVTAGKKSRLDGVDTLEERQAARVFVSGDCDGGG
jgi:hypothetical protein